MKKETAHHPKRQQTSTTLHVFQDNYLHTRAVFVNIGIYIIDRACSTKWGEEECIWTTVGKLEGKRPLGRPRHRWVDNIKERYDGVVWTGSIWLRIGTNGGLLLTRQ
jgi:hypothetical protein